MNTRAIFRQTNLNVEQNLHIRVLQVQFISIYSLFLFTA